MGNTKTLLVMLLAGTIAGAMAGRVSAEESTAVEERRAAQAQREVVDIEAEMRAAEARLEEAARRIAELSTRRLPQIDARRFSFEFSGRPVLGITIDGERGDGPVEGVVVRGVTPGGPAVEAGLRAGDVITAINDEPLAADSSAAANRRLLDFMAGVEEGDTLDLEYLRDGTVAEVTLEPHARSPRMFAFGLPEAPRAPHAPAAPGFSQFVFLGRGGWGDMEMVPLTEDLGRYFGTDRGLLVVRAPSDDSLKLEDGDVIHAIDGREPTSVSHAVRILGSYQSGEALKIEIMRDQRRQTLDIEMPDRRSSRLAPAVDRLRAPRAAPGVRIAPEGTVEARRDSSR